MSSSRNGDQDGHRGPARRLRFDGFPGFAAGSTSRMPRSEPGIATGSQLPEGHSGRRFVIVAVCSILAIWGLLSLFFRDWRTRYRARASYGATRVVPAIDPLSAIVPPDVEANAWHDAVRQTHAMLLTVTSSNLLELEQMQALRAELDQAVARARAHPESALSELAKIWNDMADHGEFLLKGDRLAGDERHPRPRILPPRPRKPPAALPKKSR